MAEKIYLIGIAGGTCSGKTYLANSLVEYFGKDFCLLFSNLKLGEQSRYLSKINNLL